MSVSLSDPLRLPCGLTLRNRVLKAALAEQMASATAHEPDGHFTTAYQTWAAGGWAAVMTGNVQVDPTYLGAPLDLVLGNDLADARTQQLWRDFARTIQRDGAAAIVQLNHPGRQSPTGAGTKPLLSKNLAPSAISLDVGRALVARAAGALLWGTPRAMSVAEIAHVVQRFATCARFLSAAGFAGIELHAAHGYLLAQFLSSRSNTRTDAYGGSPANRARIVVEILRAVRAAVPASFAVGIKLNSVDHQQAGELSAALAQIALLVDTSLHTGSGGIDFLEISGGSYEDTQMMQDVGPGRNSARRQSAHSSAREAFFLDFARHVRQQFPATPLMLTGGFRTRAGMQAALAEGACDLVGLGRVAVVEPAWPLRHLPCREGTEHSSSSTGAAEDGIWLDTVPQHWTLKYIPVKPLGAGAENEYYARQIRRMGRGLEPIAPGRSVIAAHKL